MSFHPGFLILAEMQARGWSAIRMAREMGATDRYVRALIAERVALTDVMAERVGLAFGTSAELWQNLAKAWREKGGGS